MATGFTKNFVVKNGLTTGNINLYAGNSNVSANYVVANLSVPASANLGAVGNVTITGGTSGQYLQTNGSGGLSWATVTGSGTYSNSNVASYLPTYTGNIAAGNILTNHLLYSNGTAWSFSSTPGGNTSEIQYNNGGSFAGIPSLTYDGTSLYVNTSLWLYSDLNSCVGNINGTVFNAGYYYGDGSNISNLHGANVTGTVANATYAVSAGSATTSGTVTSNAQPNITSIGTLSSLIVNGNNTSGNAK